MAPVPWAPSAEAIIANPKVSQRTKNRNPASSPQPQRLPELPTCPVVLVCCLRKASQYVLKQDRTILSRFCGCILSQYLSQPPPILTLPDSSCRGHRWSLSCRMHELTLGLRPACAGLSRKYWGEMEKPKTPLNYMPICTPILPAHTLKRTSLNLPEFNALCPPGTMPKLLCHFHFLGPSDQL